MKKFKVEMTRIDNVQVELNEEFFNTEWFEDWNKYFYDHYTLEEVVEHIIWNVVHRSSYEVEGIGIPLRDGERPLWLADDTVVNENVNVIFNQYDTDVEYDLEEVASDDVKI